MSQLQFEIQEQIDNIDFVHFVDDEAVYASFKNVVLKREKGESHFRPIATLPCNLLDRLKLSVKLSRRVFRKRVENVMALPSGTVLAAMDGKIYRIQRNGLTECVYELERGRGTLHRGMAVDPAGCVYIAEYCRNSERSDVAVHKGCDDGQFWAVCYRSDPGKLRHYHGVFYDTFEDCLWLTSGDEPGENWIMKANLDFSEMRFIGDGSKFYSAVNLIPCEDGIYFGNDDPFGPNYICRLDRESLEVERLQLINGPAWYGYQTNDGLLLFASTVESQDTASDKLAHLYVSSDNRSWKAVHSWPKDGWYPWSVFQLGVINFPGGRATSSDEIWISGQAFNGFDMSTCKGALSLDNSRITESSVKPKVLMLLPDLSWCSPVQGAVALAGHLGKSGVEVTLGSLEERGVGTDLIKAELQFLGIDTYCFHLPGLRGVLGVQQVRKYLRENEFNVVVSYGFRADLMNWALRKAVLRVCSIRENYDAWRRRFGWKGALAGRLMAKIWRDVEGLVTLTQAMADDLRQNGIQQTPIKVVPNFIDTAAIKRQLAVQPTQEETEDLLIGYFGVLENWKRVDVTLEAVASVIHENRLTDVHYHVVGDGPERRDLEKLARSLNIEQYVTFHGYVPRPWSLMAQVHIHLLASESEGLPRCIMEGMALGKTCIASNLLGMSELIEHGQTGYLVKPGDMNSMRDALQDVINARLLLPSWEIAEYIESHHDAPVCGQMFLDGLNDLLTLKS